MPSHLPLIIIGAGGHAKVVLDACLATGHRVLGLADADSSRHGTKVLGIPVTGGDDWVRTFACADVMLVNGIGSVGDSSSRAGIQATFAALGYRFATIIHPSVVIGREVELADGAQVMAGAVIQPGCRLANGAIVNTRAAIDHDCRIGAHAHIAPGAVLAGEVSVGEGAHVGAGASVIQGIRIGAGAVIGAGAAVVRDVAAGKLALGIPAKEIGTFK
ncbi:carbonic anhydrase [Paramagnetospirillum caucaseum]|uniref:Carbonic anhydrase n=1 Tax=Paramagnetospirillum caucaseum TaxID=1244869 RepID=M2ZPT1_9PROT|nr:acetyltransferase [Paramagnetospirillum caucaseum]EME69312.1 carbonic anhydrase [Paramagnetospirillum caucaseum]